jgi:predicted acyl esterase
MLAFNARPPDPLVVGDSWRERWLERLEATPPFVEAWLSHQRRDEFWKQGSVCEGYAAIECAVYAVGGWADPYRNAVFRLLEGLPGPKKALIGPWSHNLHHCRRRSALGRCPLGADEHSEAGRLVRPGRDGERPLG